MTVKRASRPRRAAASRNTPNPLRGSSRRPKKTISTGAPSGLSVRALQYSDVSTPLGMRTGSVPTCSTCHRLANSLTAMPPRIFSKLERSTGSTALSASEDVADAW